MTVFCCFTTGATEAVTLFLAGGFLLEGCGLPFIGKSSDSEE